jgi:phage shock protein C
MSQPYKTLYRSRSNRLIGGVAAGIGDYLGIDPTVVRLLFVFFGLVGWVAPAIVVYLVMLFVVPEEPITSISSSVPSVRETAPASEAAASPVQAEANTPEGSGEEVFEASPPDSEPQS